MNISAPSAASLESYLMSSEVIRVGHFRHHARTPQEEKHGSKYVYSRAIFRDYEVGLHLVQCLLEKTPPEILRDVQVVVGPATGGAVLAYMISALISPHREPSNSVKTIFLSGDDLLIQKSDYRFLEDRRVLLVDDIRHTGRTFAIGSVRIAEAGGRLVGTAEIVDRGMKTLPLQPRAVPNYCLVELQPEPLYKPKDCQQCKDKVPYTTL